MITKLTLTIEETVVKSAKQYARKKGHSLSKLVQNYLKSISKNESDPQEISPRVRKLVGAVKLPKGFDYKKSIEQELSSKYRK
jgi:hypothetical protein